MHAVRAGSTVTAGNDLTIIARGAGSDSDITVTGSTLAAGNNAVLKADGDILLQAAKNLYEEKTRSKSSGGSIGIGLSTGQQNGITIEAGMNTSRSKEDGKDNSWTNSNIVAGNVLAIESGGNTTFSGAAGRADQIIASVGGNLLLESLQDSSRFKSSQTNAGFSVSLCIPPICYGSSSGSVNVGAGYMKSNFDSVTQQAGLWAGDGGFQIDVKGNTSLVGAVIGSSEKAVADRLNQLATGTLITKDIKNEAEYKAAQVSLGISPSLGKTSLSPPGVALAYDNSKSTTESAISGGTIIIRDAVAQQDLTGMTVSETIANLNRDTSNTLNALKPIFDKEKIEAGFEIALEFQRQSGTFLQNRAREIDALEAAAKNPENSPAVREEAARKAAELKADWGPGGTYRRIMTAMSAVSGNVTGSAGELVQRAAISYFQGLGATKVKELSADLGIREGSPAHIALHGLVACAGSSAQGGSCGSAAMGVASGIVLNSLLDSVAKAEQPGSRNAANETRIQLVRSILAGITGALSPADLAVVDNAAQQEMENNRNLPGRMLPLPTAPGGGAGTLLGGTISNTQRDLDLLAAAQGKGANRLDTWDAFFANLNAWLFGDLPDVETPPYPADENRDNQLPPSVAGDPNRDDVLLPGQPSSPQPVPGPLVSPIDSGEQYGDGMLPSPMPTPAGPDLIYNTPDGAKASDGAVKLTFDKATRTWTTPAGLDYGQGSIQGNRVLHVLEHAEPNPAKTTHSVFSMDRKEILGAVDEAWLKKGSPVVGDPGAYVVPMGRAIGTAGETSIKIIVRPGTNQVITAYPVK